MKKEKKEKFINVNVDDIIKDDYLTYAASSLIRMLPNSIDGLKPVQRRILHTMWEMKATSFTKSADVVGRTMQYAPHGDQAIYAALVVMAQQDRNKNTLITGQGNFGYITDHLNEYAASRYTEVKLSDYVQDFYFTEDYTYTDTMMTYKGFSDIREPVVFPTLLPMGLVQGSRGITPGFSNHIIPHKLNSIAEAYILYIKNRNNVTKWKKMEKEIYDKIEIGFPNKCKIIRHSETGLQTGKGQIIAQGRCRVLDGKRSKKIIQVYQLPYLVEIPNFVSEVDAVLQRHGYLAGITDESGKEGVNVNIILKKDVSVKEALDLISTKTSFRNKYNYSLVINDNNTPKRMNVINLFESHYQYKTRIMEKYLEDKKRTLSFRQECLTGALYILSNPKRRSEFFKLLEASDKDNIIKTLLIRYSLQPHVSEYLINRKFSSLLGKIGDLKKEKDNVEEEINDILSKLNDIDKYLISQIKEKVKKYIK